MPFVNPLDALGIAPEVLPSYDTPRTARRRRALDFQLADGVEVNGVEISRSDFDRATSDLDDPELVRGFHALRSHPTLNRFLATGDPAYFDAPPPPVPDARAIRRAVGSEYAEAFGKALALALRDGKADLVQKMAQSTPLFDPCDAERTQRPIDELLAQTEREVDDMTARLRRGEGNAADTAVDLAFEVRPQALNALPSTFSSGRTQIARSVRNLGVAAFNDGDDPDAAYQILSVAVGLDVSDEDAEDVEQQLSTIRLIRDRRRLNEEHAPALAAAAEAIDELHTLAESAEQGRKHAEAASLKALLFDTDVVNSLPGLLSEVRVQVALALRGLSVAIWNSSQLLLAASRPLELALQLKLPDATKSKLEEDLSELARLAKQNEAHERKEVMVLGGVLLELRTKTSHVKGYETNWPAVSGMMSKLLGNDSVSILASAQSHSPDEVRGVVRAALPFIAGLHKYARPSYDSLALRLKPLASEDPAIERMISHSGLTQAAQSDADVKRTTSDKEIWQHPWFWWVAFFAMAFILSNC